MPGLDGATCAKKGCERKAWVFPVLLMRTAPTGQALVVHQSIPSCRGCAKKAKVSDFMTNKGYLEICAGLEANGFDPPVREYTTLEWYSIETDQPPMWKEKQDVEKEQR